MTNELKYLWTRTFGNAPSTAILAQFARYIESVESDERQRIVYAFLFKSAAFDFRSEGERAVWVTEQIQALHRSTDGKANPLVEADAL